MEAKILVVDDDPLISELLIQTLCQVENGYTFYKAINGEDGIAIATDILPDLIVMDWEMPGMSGIETCKRLKSNPLLASTPVIISTGVMISSENLKSALDAGAVDFIRKPYDRFELQARVNSALMLAQSWRTIVKQREQILVQEKERLERELEFRSKELINQMLFISTNCNRIEKVIEQVKGLYPYLNKTGNKILEQIVRESTTTLEQTFWTDFELHFDAIYPSFLKNLHARHPDLTQSERRLCAFIRLNMSTKDIAAIAHLELQSVNMARSRLRSKLGLERDANLFVYLSMIS
jgi:DNA-binding response OmpR family regulator/DNA-binding CsgD family transcriptional regulator